jgi:hypothetical protein
MFSLSKQEVISYLAPRRSNSARPGQPFCLGGMTRKRALSFPIARQPYRPAMKDPSRLEPALPTNSCMQPAHSTEKWRSGMPGFFSACENVGNSDVARRY